MEMREQERDRALRVIAEELQRTRAVWTTFAPQIFDQSARSWEKREGERE
jgi:hypothetical protein